jgi:hypothetical protein
MNFSFHEEMQVFVDRGMEQGDMETWPAYCALRLLASARILNVFAYVVLAERFCSMEKEKAFVKQRQKPVALSLTFYAIADLPQVAFADSRRSTSDFLGLQREFSFLSLSLSI